MEEIFEKLREIEALEKDPFNKIFFDKDIWSEELELNEDIALLEMANVLGSRCKIEDIDFTFYLSTKLGMKHGIRVKIIWNADHFDKDKLGYIQAHGDYKYGQDPSQKFKPKSYDIDTARYLVKRYKVLFAAVWEMKLEADHVADYFKGRMSWKELMDSFYNIENEEIKEVLSNCRNLKDLEYAVRKNNIFNMND